ncbi:hypothetical protein LBMAG53_12850 [Planctomycetota bacterium]|nr:hypothetical protein LBMAG53_12850 [Planctomycetota bacterium]
MNRTLACAAFLISASFIHAADQVDAFVTRMYQVVLLRTPDSGGLAYWGNNLRGGSITGGGLALSFFYGSEYLARNRTNGQFVDDTYQGCFNRAADSGGSTYWNTALANGLPRFDVSYGFVMSAEFQTLCTTYGVVAKSAAEAKIGNTRSFVRRLYNVCLAREPDAGGIQHWTNGLVNGTVGGKDVTESFFWNAEFHARNTNLANYLTYHYRAFLNRDPDAGGLAAWTASYTSGSNSRRDITRGFADATEFVSLCSAYGISAGSTATGAILTISGSVKDNGTATVGNEVRCQKQDQLFDIRVTSASGAFSFKTRPGDSIDLYQVVVAAAQ